MTFILHTYKKKPFPFSHFCSDYKSIVLFIKIKTMKKRKKTK